MYSNFSLKQDYITLCHYIYKEFKISISDCMGLLFVQY